MITTEINYRGALALCILFIILPILGEDTLYYPTPEGHATAQIGFNYDYLRDPFEIDFEKGLGYFAINIPVGIKAGSGMMDRYFRKINEGNSDGQYFTPEIKVQQFPNTTIRVDLPLLGGVATFSHINIFKADYRNNLGIPSLLYTSNAEDSGDTTDIIIRGSMNIPAEMRMGWEALSFGYAYQVTDLFAASFTMNRHSFYFDLYGNVDMDLVGTAEYRNSMLSKDIPIDYSLHSSIDGYYELQRWTPTVGLKLWRFTAIARFGFSDEAEGSLVGDYEVPFFINPKTFQPDDDLGSPQYLIDNLDRFENNEVTHVNLSTSKPLQWEVPHGFTLKFDIVPKTLSISYTKFVGSVRLELHDTTSSTDSTIVNEVIDLKSVSTVDHIIVLNGRFKYVFFNMGVFSFENLLGNADIMPQYGQGILVPILSGGFVVGGQFEVVGELDVFPFAAVKLGIQYHFRK